MKSWKKLWGLIVASMTSALPLEAADPQYPIREGAGPMHPTREELARDVEADFHDLDTLLRQYAKQHGRLPKSLELVPGVSKYSGDWEHTDKDCHRNYGYAVSDDGMVAILVSVGIDGKPNTSDDITMLVDIRAESESGKRDLRSNLLKAVAANWPCT